MIYFITSDPYHIDFYTKGLYDGIEVLSDSKESVEIFNKYITDLSLLGYDVESNGLDAYKNKTVLKIFGDSNVQFIFHTPYCNFKPYLESIVKHDPTLLGHNIKFDLKFLKTEDKVLYRKVYDTMVAEQRIYMKSGLSSGLADLCIRYLNEFPVEMDKTIRNEFIDCNTSTFKVLPRHLYYGAGDVKNLFPIKEKQKLLIEKYRLTRLLNKIEFPLVSILADMELEGFVLNIEKWTEVYNENKARLFEIELELDKEFLKLRDKKLTIKEDNKRYIKNGKWDNPRKHNPLYDLFNDDGTTNNLDLFGQPMSKQTLTKTKTKVKPNPNNINYGSDTQIMEIFGRLEQPLLNQRDTLVIPTFNKKGKIDKVLDNYQTNADSFSLYRSMLPGSPMSEFIALLMKHRGLRKAISTYGINFIGHINPITGKLHTSFKQCFTDTGRLSSGGGKKEPDKPNFQNIPSRADYAIKMRNCFGVEEGYSVGTHDLSGAELIIMCSLSQDMKLLKVASQDIHSYVAEGCWRAIYRDRAIKLMDSHESLRKQHGENYRDESIIKQINEYIELAKTYIVDKSKPKIRTAFKPMTFGTIYGMYANKAAKTLNISKEEGQIVINFIKHEFPDVFAMVEQASAFARKNGYIVLNNVNNTRAWFPNIIKVLKGLLSERENYGIISKEESEARNIKIQGTQADMIKECMVNIQQWIDDNNYYDEIKLLSNIHDEIVDKHPNYLNGKSEEWFDWWYTNDNYLYYNNKPYNSFAELKSQIMRDTCNQYLNNVKMEVEYDVEPYWTK